MELLFLALPFVTSSLMFFYKKVATLSMFDNGAAARPWLRALLILTSVAGVVATALLNGQPLNPDSISTLVQLLFGTAANAYLSHAFYRSVTPTE
jgi:hypothetical protein